MKRLPLVLFLLVMSHALAGERVTADYKFGGREHLLTFLSQWSRRVSSGPIGLIAFVKSEKTPHVLTIRNYPEVFQIDLNLIQRSKENTKAKAFSQPMREEPMDLPIRVSLSDAQVDAIKNFSAREGLAISGGALGAPYEGKIEAYCKIMLIRFDRDLPKMDRMAAFIVTQLYGEDSQSFTLTTLEEAPNQPPQRNAGSRPSSDNLPVSETPSSLGPRG